MGNDLTGDMEQSLYAIDFVVKLITLSFRNNMNPGAGDPGGVGVLPYMGYIGMCCGIGYGF